MLQSVVETWAEAAAQSKAEYRDQLGLLFAQ